MVEERGKPKTALIALLFFVLIVRLLYLMAFHHQVFLGPSTLFEQAFVATNILEGNGLKTYQSPPPVVESEEPSQLIDPEDYIITSTALVPYIKDVTGYAFFLSFLWLIAGIKLWIFAQGAQVLFDLLASLGLYFLTKTAFGQKAALLCVFVFSILFFEARASVVPYKDIFNLYFMLINTLLAGQIFFQKGKPIVWFTVICLVTGLGFYFMPSLVLYPLFLTGILIVIKRISWKVGLSFLLMAVVMVGLVVFPHFNHVRSYQDNPQIPEPLFWYRFWLGTKVEVFYSTQEERFEDYFKEKIDSTGLTLEEICKQEFLDYVRNNPLKYVLNTGKKLLFGMFLVYANAGDCTSAKSWSQYHSTQPQASFTDYARSHPLRILGMILGTLSISLLFPLSSAAVIILIRERKGNLALFFFHIPCYFLLLHMFFHYEARYLLGTLPGYVPLVGYLMTKFRLFGRKSTQDSAGYR